MSITSPIADFLTQIRNALKAKKSHVSVPNSKEKRAILEVFLDNGYIKGYHVIDDASYRKQLLVELKYAPNTQEPVIAKLGVISRPGLRRYAGVDEIPHTLNGLGITVVSTSKGIISDKEARKSRLGGELICYIQ